MNIGSFLAFFSLIMVSVAVYSLSRKYRVPYSVLLVLFGTILVPIAGIPAFSFLKGFDLTPEILFFVFLPILIFESAYNMRVRELAANIRAVSWLSVASLLISAAFVSASIFFLFRLIGFDIPFIVALLFGALISATDPVAVLALFKEYGAPRRLSLLFEGESLFNDGTSFALFLVVLEIFLRGYSGWGSVVEGVVLFAVMIIGGTLFGLVMGVCFSKLIGRVSDDENLEVTLTMLSAHFTFLLSEVLSEHMHLFGMEFRFSSIIATVMTAMVIGNYGRAKISPRVEEYMEKFWGYFAFISNSLVFILMGILFASLPIRFGQFAIPILLTILVVMAGRAVSVYPVVGLLNRSGKEREIPMSWQHLLSWGSLRGALAVIMVLLIPEDATVRGWNYPFTVREFVTALTIGCVYFTLFFKATTISRLMKRLGVGSLHALEEAQYHQAKSLIHAKAISALERFLDRGYVDTNVYEVLRKEHDAGYEESQKRCRAFFSESDPTRAEQALHIYAIGIERHFLRVLFRYGEVTEPVYKRILAKLDVQQERVEHAERQIVSLDEVFREDWIEQFVRFFRRLLLGKASNEVSIADRYAYYRAQGIISKKVAIHLSSFLSGSGFDTFGNRAILEKVIAQYGSFREDAEKKGAELFSANRRRLEALNETFGRRGLFKAEESVLDDLTENEMITPKLSVMLRDELHEREYSTAERRG
ncbi:MAG: sodium:proton antiporter [Candidatus Moranbacteria bacterium]|nr:sodium:proton antiporter [Candidatus Moranbacteria bacterium]NTW76022.1 sodium:proton antiporter [Candidatus Moranbacteria bacterium]